eukprot:NODE_16867_length_973_cov_6.457447.p2 GENE.NODE_16867_length_973_cov_6.457447~~NODE_16867_length_973_cov_6.457447.p2  ORF type:complete len:207 (-),score=62.46 NODE_16867_length_973_cov_6.457447:5-625(-)
MASIIGDMHEPRVFDHSAQEGLGPTMAAVFAAMPPPLAVLNAARAFARAAGPFDCASLRRADAEYYPRRPPPLPRSEEVCAGGMYFKEPNNVWCAPLTCLLRPGRRLYLASAPWEHNVTRGAAAAALLRAQGALPEHLLLAPTLSHMQRSAAQQMACELAQEFYGTEMSSWSEVVAGRRRHAGKPVRWLSELSCARRPSIQWPSNP